MIHRLLCNISFCACTMYTWDILEDTHHRRFNGSKLHCTCLGWRAFIWRGLISGRLWYMECITFSIQLDIVHCKCTFINWSSTVPVEFHHDSAQVQTVETRPFLHPLSGLWMRLGVVDLNQIFIDRSSVLANQSTSQLGLSFGNLFISLG